MKNGVKFNPKIFLPYDVRGSYPRDLNEHAAYAIGRALVLFLHTSRSSKKKLSIAIGRDIRPSSLSLFHALARGIRDQGGDAVDIGLVTTPMLYFSVVTRELDGGITITASHNPNPSNGFKFVGRGAVPIAWNSGLREVKAIACHAPWRDPKRRGRRIKKNIIRPYLAHELPRFRHIKKRFVIAVDGGNGLAGVIVPRLFKKIGITPKPLYLTPDGNFPHHIPDPLIRENRKDLVALIKKNRVDFGLAFDGDCDRIFFLDGRGRFIPGDIMMAFVARELLREYPGEKVLYDVRSSNIVPETIKNAGGVPIVSRIGHSFIKKAMRKHNALFAGEFSGHYYLRENGFFEAPFFVLAKVMEVIEREGKPLHELILPFFRYAHSGEINFEIEDKLGTMRKIERAFRTGRISRIDGLRINFRDWWFNLRPSNTEPLLRLVIEARTKKLMEAKKRRLVHLIGRAHLIGIAKYKQKQVAKA